MKKIIIILLILNTFIVSSYAQFTLLSDKVFFKGFAVDKEGKVYSCFKNKNDKYIIRVFDGQKWEELGGEGKSVFSREIDKILIDSSGDVYAFMQFFGIYHWNGSSWNSIWDKEKFVGIEPRELTMDDRSNIFVLYLKNSIDNEYKFLRWDSKTWQEEKGKFKDMFWQCGYKPYEAFYDDKNKFNVYTIDAKQISKKVAYNESVDSKGVKDVEYVRNSIIKWESKKWVDVFNQNADLLDYEGSLTQYSCDYTIIKDFTFFSENNIYIQMPNCILKFDGSNWAKISNNKLNIGNKSAEIGNLFKGEDGYLYVTAFIPEWTDVKPTFYLLKYKDGKFLPIWSITQNEEKNVYIDKISDVKIDKFGNSYCKVRKKSNQGFSIYKYAITNK